MFCSMGLKLLSTRWSIPDDLSIHNLNTKNIEDFFLVGAEKQSFRFYSLRIKQTRKHLFKNKNYIYQSSIFRRNLYGAYTPRKQHFFIDDRKTPHHI